MESSIVADDEKEAEVPNFAVSLIYRERRRYLEKINPRLAFICDIFLCLAVRMILLIHSILCIFYLVSSTNVNNYTFLILVVLLIFIIVDAAVVTVKRRGKEWFW